MSSWSALVRNPGFWLMLIANAIGGAVEVELIPTTGVPHKVAVLALMLLGTVGFGYHHQAVMGAAGAASSAKVALELAQQQNTEQPPPPAKAA